MRPIRWGIAVVVGCALAVPALGGGPSGWVEFMDETSSRLIADSSVGVNDVNEKDYAWGDFDKDGDTDLVCVRKEPFTTPGRRRNVLFMNEGIAEGHAINGILVDRTVEFGSDADDGGDGLLDLTNDRDVVVADFNGDTWLDFATATTISDGLPKTISHPRIYINKKNDGGGNWQGFRYEEPRIPQIFTVGTNIPVAPRFCSVATGDVTGDGMPDLYFGDYDSSGVGGGSPENPANDVDDRLFINDGNGFFTDSLETRMTSQMLLSAFSMAAIIVDINKDGVNDVIKDTALNTPQRVSVSYNNPSNEGFFDDFDVIVPSASPYHINIGDLNNDTWLDLVVTDDGQDFYMLNQHNGGDGMANFTTFTLTRAAGADGDFGGNNIIVDMNNDGFNDIFVADNDVDIPGCTRGSHLYRNLGNMPNVTLQEQSGAAPWTPDGVHDEAIFDLNGDTWKDMIIGTCTTTQVWINQAPNDLVYSYPDGLPGVITPDEDTVFHVQITATGAQPVSGSGKQFVSIDGGPYVESNMVEESPNLYVADLPAVGCASEVHFYFSVETTAGATLFDPRNAPGTSYSSLASLGTAVVIDDRFETELPGWTVTDDATLTAGTWERVDPVGTFFPIGSTTPCQPEDDYGAASEEVTCYVTQQHNPGDSAGVDDVDGGATILTSPVINLNASDGVVTYARWQHSNVGGTSVPDKLITQVTSNGVDWVEVGYTFSTAGEWQSTFFKVSEFVHPTAGVQVRFISSDNPNNSYTESGIDNFRVIKLICQEPCDVDEDCDDGNFCNGKEFCDGGFCAAGGDACGGATCYEATQSCDREVQRRTGEPIHGLNEDQLERFDAGQVLFDNDLTELDGLGPIFNQTGCGSCHNAGGLGGSGSTLVTRFGFQDKGFFDDLAQYGGSLQQSQSVSKECAEVVPVEANVVINRVTNSTFGGGLVEAIGDSEILARESVPPPGVSGRAHMVLALEDPGAGLLVGRFGWKAQLPTILSFSGDAAANEMGFTNRLVPDEQDPNGTRPPDLIDCDMVADPEDGPDADGFDFIDRVTDFQRFLAPPPQTPRSGMTGEAVFNSIGCNSCHVATFVTSQAPEPVLTAKTIHPYSDFLLHDMGQLGDGIQQGDAQITELRTPALWGLRVRGQFLHDGRVNSGTFDSKMTDVIGWHGAAGSEAAASSVAYDALSGADKDALIAFLDSLGRAEFDHDGDNDVDLTDYDTFDACFTGQAPGTYTADDPCAISDFDQDGDVDFKDYDGMQRAFTGPGA